MAVDKSAWKKKTWSPKSLEDQDDISENKTKKDLYPSGSKLRVLHGLAIHLPYSISNRNNYLQSSSILWYSTETPNKQ